MDRLDAMNVFVTVVETGSFSAAGRKLNKPLTTISRRISDLEAYLNTRLLTRSTRSLALTEAGAAYLSAAKRILEEVGVAERTAGGEFTAPRGELVMTAPVVFGRLHVLPIVQDFLAAYPDVDIRLTLSDRNVHLVDDQVDVALRIGDLPDSSLRAIRVGEVRRVICASREFLAAHGTPEKPEDLSAIPCVTFDVLASPASWTFPRRGSRSDQVVSLRSRLSVNTAEAAIDAAVAGVGATRVLSYQIDAALRGNQLQVVLADFEPAPMPVNLIHAGQGLLPLKMRTFMEFAAPRLRQRMARILPTS